MRFRAYALTDGMDISRFVGTLWGPANHQHLGGNQSSEKDRGIRQQLQTRFSAG